MPPQTKKSFPQAWGLIPQTSPTFPQTWGLSADTWGIVAEAWGRGVEAGPTFPHVSKLGAVSRKHPADPWGNCGEIWGSFPQAWGMNPQPSATNPQASQSFPQASALIPHVWGKTPQAGGTSAGAWDSSFETRGKAGVAPSRRAAKGRRPCFILKIVGQTSWLVGRASSRIVATDPAREHARTADRRGCSTRDDGLRSRLLITAHRRAGGGTAP